VIVAAVEDYVTAAPISFVAGAVVGFLLSNRYRLVKRRNGEPGP
jgi:hypothetical protein